ncbi:uncharacterized protein [Battus philenor]|uniref:uncharacterized protein n=1 Tax=Battus philenor TaxID=42288 RepID=UPI0035D0A297
MWVVLGMFRRGPKLAGLGAYYRFFPEPRNGQGLHSPRDEPLRLEVHSASADTGQPVIPVGTGGSVPVRSCEEENLFKNNPNPKVGPCRRDEWLEGSSGGTSDAGESTPGPCPGSPAVSGGGKNLRRGNASASAAGPLTSVAQNFKEPEVPDRPSGSVRDKRGRSMRSAGLAISMVGESDGGSDASRASVGPGAFSRAGKRKAKPPSPGAVAAKYAAYSAQETEGTETVGGTDSDEEGLFDPSVQPLRTRSKKGLPSQEQLARELRACADPRQYAETNLLAIEKVTDRSSNLKGTYVRSLRLAARNVKAALEEMSRRTAGDSTVEKLEQENAELRSQLSSLSAKVESLTMELRRVRSATTEQAKAAAPAPPRARPAPVPRTSASTEEGLMHRIGALIESKLAAFEAKLFPDRAIRPPLAASRTGPRPTQSTVPSEPIAPPQPPQAPPASQPPRPRRSRRPRRKTAPPPVPELPPVTAPPPAASAITTRNTWAEVARKPRSAPRPVPRPSAKPPAAPRSRGTKKAKRAPTTAAVTVTLPEGSTSTYAEVVEAAKARIRLADLGIEALRQKRALTGALLLEISGEDCGRKADDLAARMREVLRDVAVKISRPVKTSEIRLRDLDDAVSPGEVAEAVAEAGGCSVDDVKVGDVHRTNTSMGTCWLRCPVKVAHALVTAGRVRVGWGSVRVAPLEPRPMHCFRCLEKGHVGARCPNSVNRSMRCFACGESGHKARECVSSALKCPLCSDLGLPSNHRLGKRCGPTPGKGRRSKKTPPATTSTAAAAAPTAAPGVSSDMEVA